MISGAAKAIPRIVQTAAASGDRHAYQFSKSFKASISSVVVIDQFERLSIGPIQVQVQVSTVQYLYGIDTGTV